MAWTKDWTPESVENNYRVIGIIDESDIEQLLTDSKILTRIERVMGSRFMSDIEEMVDNAEDQGDDE